jgi:hypothetical protein
MMKRSLPASFLAATIVFWLVSAARAEVLYQATETDWSNVTTVTQTSAGITNGDSACGPTSVYNSFLYLQQANPTANLGALFQAAGGGNSQAANTINTLGGYMGGNGTNTGNGTPNGGVTSAQFLAGKNAYLNKYASGLLTVVSETGNSNVTAGFIRDQLNMKEDVEIKFDWTGRGASGAHFVALTGINFNATTNTGTISFIDPSTGKNTTATLTSNATGYTLTYPNGQTGRIYSVVAESLAPNADQNGGNTPGRGDDVDEDAGPSGNPTPEPATIVLFGVGFTGMFGYGWRRRSLAAV